MIRIDDPDIPIYRIFRLSHFWKALRGRYLVLVSPRQWDDPFENFLAMCAITDTSQPKWTQEFFDKLRKPLYAQCWSMVEESDTLWRAYSHVRKHSRTNRNTYRHLEGVQVRTTPRKLLQALWKWCPSDTGESCFIGRVKYMGQQEVKQYIANEIGHSRLQSFPGGLGHAESILFKRSAFAHEVEVRLIYVEHQGKHTETNRLTLPIDPDILFEEVIFDPRLADFERLEREDECRKLGFIGKIGRSGLYQRTLLEIVIS